MDYKKEIISAIQKISGRYSVYEVFADWVKMTAIAISNTIDINNYPSREKEYMELSSKYTLDELMQMSEMCSLLTRACEEKMEDVLGYIYICLLYTSDAADEL